MLALFLAASVVFLAANVYVYAAGLMASRRARKNAQVLLAWQREQAVRDRAEREAAAAQRKRRGPGPFERAGLIPPQE
jgi:hypothetical protein